MAVRWSIPEIHERHSDLMHPTNSLYNKLSARMLHIDWLKRIHQITSSFMDTKPQQNKCIIKDIQTKSKSIEWNQYGAQLLRMSWTLYKNHFRVERRAAMKTSLEPSSGQEENERLWRQLQVLWILDCKTEFGDFRIRFSVFNDQILDQSPGLEIRKTDSKFQIRIQNLESVPQFGFKALNRVLRSWIWIYRFLNPEQFRLEFRSPWIDMITLLFDAVYIEIISQFQPNAHTNLCWKYWERREQSTKLLKWSA